jgi:hypothetical protein
MAGSGAGAAKELIENLIKVATARSRTRGVAKSCTVDLRFRNSERGGIDSCGGHPDGGIEDIDGLFCE